MDTYTTKTIGLALNDVLNEGYAEKIQSIANDHGYNVVQLPNDDNASGVVRNCEIIFGFIKPDLLSLAHNLRWFQCSFAGVEGFADMSLYANPDTVLTNAAGAFGVTISEHLICTLLMMFRHMPYYVHGHDNAQWIQKTPIRSIYGSKITVIGMGDIGTNFAKRMHALGAEVRGVKRNRALKPDYLSALYTSEEIDIAISDADAVVLCLPSTHETQHIIDKRRLGLMPSSAILMNVGRGSAIDQDALVEALDNNKLGGAVLDVTVPEPLPNDHPLWSAKNCFITPHVSGTTSLALTCDYIVNIFLDNLKRYVSGEALEHVVDMKAGY